MRIFRSPWLWGILTFLVALRIMAPELILRKMNAVLAEFSETYAGHIQDVDISLIRGAYQLEGLKLYLKQKPQQTFFQVKLVDISIAWRELLKGQILSDIQVDQAHVVLTKRVLDAFGKNTAQAEDDSKEAAKTLFPLKLERLDIKNSEFEFAELLSIPEAPRWRITKLNGRASNVTATEGSPLTLASLKGNLFDDATIIAVAQVNQLLNPIAWDVDLEVKDFNLPEANAWLKGKVPLTITSGKLDAFAEVLSEKGRIEGYVKPFVHKADIIAGTEKFKGFKHFAIEVSTAAANLIFRTSKEKTLATKLLFSYDKAGFQFNSSKAISEAFKNGFQEKLNPGLDDEISLSNASKAPLTSGEKL